MQSSRFVASSGLSRRRLAFAANEYRVRQSNVLEVAGHLLRGTPFRVGAGLGVRVGGEPALGGGGLEPPGRLVGWSLDGCAAAAPLAG